MGRLHRVGAPIIWVMIYVLALTPLLNRPAYAPDDDAIVSLPQGSLTPGLTPATLSDLAISVNGRLDPRVDDPRALEVARMIQLGHVTPVNLDFVVQQGIRVSSTGTLQRFADGVSFNHPVPSSSNINDIKILAQGEDLVFQIGEQAPADPAFKPELEHVVPGVRVAGENGKQFARTSANLYLVNRNGDGSLDALRSVSIPQLEGTSRHKGALFNGTFLVAHTIALGHLPKDWKYEGVSLLAQNQSPRELLRIDNLEPLPEEFEKGGQDICLTFKDGSGATKSVWVPQEIANQRQIRRMEQLTWLALLDDGGVDESEREALAAYLKSMAVESGAIEEARAELRALTQQHANALQTSDLAQRALGTMNLPWLINYLSPVSEKAKDHEGKLIELRRSRLAKLFNEQRDRFGKDWQANFDRIVRVRSVKGLPAENPETATHAWAGELRQALTEEDQLLSNFEVAAEYRKGLITEGFVSKMLNSRRMLFLATALAGAGAMAFLPGDSAPIQFLAGVGSHIIHMAEGTPMEIVFKPLTELGTMMGTAYQTGHWTKVALIGGGFAFCVSQYFLGHLIAGTVASARGMAGEFFTRSTNQMWQVYCKCIRPWTMPETLNRWIFNTGRSDRTMEARSQGNVASLDANQASRKNAREASANLATIFASARTQVEARGEQGTNDFIEKMMGEVAAATAAGQKMNVSPDLLLALSLTSGQQQGGNAQELTLEQVRERTEQMMSDPNQVERLLAIRAILIKALMSMADSEGGVPASSEIIQSRVAWYEKVAKQVAQSELTPESRNALESSFASFCRFTSKHLMTLSDFLSGVLTGVRGADIARTANKPVPKHIGDENIRRAIIDFIISEFNGALLKPATFTLPTEMKGVPGYLPALTGSWEQTFAWLMIPIGNMMLTMSRPEKLEQSASPFEATAATIAPREQTMESYLGRLFSNTYNPDPEAPGFFKNVFNYIKSGVLQHKVRCGFLALCLFAGYMVQYYTGTPEQSAQINLWTIPIISWILAYNVSFAKASISPSHIGYAMTWPAVDLSDINTKWVEENLSRIEKSMGELGSTNETLRRRGARELKVLYDEGRMSLPDRFNKPVADYSAQDLVDFYGYVVEKLPLPTRTSVLGGDLINIAGVTGTNIVYFSVFTGLFADVPTLAQASWDFLYITTWMGATAGAALGLDWASRKVAQVVEPVTSAVSSAVDSTARACRRVFSGARDINLD